MTPEQIVSDFISAATKSRRKAYAIEFNGQLLWVSGKKVWYSIGAAKNAIQHMLKGYVYAWNDPRTKEVRNNHELREKANAEILSIIKIIEI